MTKQISIQLYSLRHELAQDFEAVVQELAATGFSVVEGWANMPLSHGAIAGVLKAHGVNMPSCHLPLPEGEQKRGVLQAIEAYNLQYSIVPSLPPENFTTLDGVKRVCERLNKANEWFVGSDVAFGYHNHDFEFHDIDGRTAFEIMIDELEPSIILEVDTYWAQLAGHDPIDLVKRLGDRSPLLHIKDGEAEKDRRDDPNVALGEGKVDLAGVIAAGADNTKMLVIELDSCATDMMTAVKSSHKYLIDHGLV